MQNDNHPVQVSVIVTFNNMEEYAARCLESILNQDMSKIEVIAVNAGSTDSSRIILEKYAQKDSRVKVFNLENGGPGWARNQGVKKTCGEYIWFVDGDDFIAEESLSKLYNCAVKNDADIVIFTFRMLQNDILSKPHSFPYYKNIRMDSVTATEFKLIGEDGAIWNKFCKRNWYLEKNIQFPEGVIWEDTSTCCKMLCNAQRIFYLDEPFYYYVYRDKSLSHQLLTAKSIFDYFYSQGLIKDALREANLEQTLSDAFNFQFMMAAIWVLEHLGHPERFKTEHDFQESKKITEENFLLITPNEITSNKYLNSEEKNTLLSIRNLIITGNKSFI